jgi:hypothetical protein
VAVKMHGYEISRVRRGSGYAAGFSIARGCRRLAGVARTERPYLVRSLGTG